ncbi:MAG: TolC family protein [Odoribacteraceae bacterium]|jgi:outer membrane protein|nr:TolC family protein [Odoribacteraceae bacterium]
MKSMVVKLGYKTFIVISILSLLSVSATVCAQEKWSLNKCIMYALENNTDIQSYQLNVNAYEIMKDRTKLNYMPDLSVHTNYQLNINRSLDPVTYSFIEHTSVNSANTNISLSATVFDGFRKYYTYKKSVLDLNISQIDFEAAKNDMALSVTVNYMNVLLNKEVIKSIKQQIEISDVNITKARQLLDEGISTDERLQNLLVQRDNEQYSLTEAEGNLKKSIIALCSFLNRNDFDLFDVEDDVPSATNDSVSLEKIIVSAKSLPQIESVKLRLKAAEYSLKIAASDLYPTLSLGTSLASSFSDNRKKYIPDADGNMQYASYPFFNQLNDNRNGVISLNLNIPIFSLFQTKKNISLAKNSITQAQYEIQNAEKKLTEYIHEIYADVATARQKYLIAISSVEHSKTLLLYADNKLANGVLTISDYVVSKGNLLMSEIQAIKAKYEYLFKLKLLKFYYYHTLLHE